MEQLTAHADTGFAMLVAAWFMFRLERRMEKNTEALRSLAKAIEKSLFRGEG